MPDIMMTDKFHTAIVFFKNINKKYKQICNLYSL